MKTDRPKYPHVSYYPVKGRWRVTFRLPGSKTRTERLGVSEIKAQKRARQVSDLIDSIKSRLISAEDVASQLEDARSINVHVKAYKSYLVSTGASQSYIDITIKRVTTAISIIGAARLNHITPRAAERLIKKLRETRKPRGDGKPGDENAPFLSAQTIQHYVRALKQFTRRMKKLGRSGQDLLADIDGVKVVESAPRREVSEEEIKILLLATPKAPRKKWNEMLPADRTMLYAYAFATGLRKGELRPADIGWLDLIGKQPCLNVPGEFTKNSQAAKQPLPAWLVDASVKWLAKRSGKLFPSMPQSLHRMFQKDREFARSEWISQAKTDEEKQAREKSAVLQYRTADGVLVFHGLRHGYVSMLANTDMPAKLVQALARHGDIRTTMNRYAHAKGGLAAAAIEKNMPNLLGNQSQEVSEEPVESLNKETSNGRKRKAQRRSCVVSRNLSPLVG